MAALLNPRQAFDFCKRNIKNMPLEEIRPRLLDDVNKMIWMAAPWRWTVGTLTNISLVTNQQDYTLAPPNDFLYLLSSQIVDGSNIPQHLEIVPSLPSDVVMKGAPQFISYQGSNTFRISPNPGTLSTATVTPPTKKIVSWYKKTSPSITSKNATDAGVLVMDDEWFWVYTAGVLYVSYLYGDDQRAGSCNVDLKGNVQFTGQRAVFEAGIATMKQREPIPDFDFRLAPEQKDGNR